MKKMTKIIEFQREMYWQQYNTISNAARTAQQMVDKFNQIEAFQNITDKTWPEFAENPQHYYEAQIEAKKKQRFGDDPVNIEVFMQLYQIPELQFLSYVPEREYLTFRDGNVVMDDEALEGMKQAYTVTTNDPELIKKLDAVEKLVKQYDKVYSLLFGDKYTHLKHDFKEIGFNRHTGTFLNEIVVKFS